MSQEKEAEKRISITNFDFDPSDESITREKPVSLSENSESEIFVTSDEEDPDETVFSPVLNSRKLSGLNASILLNSA